jgi:capsule polysaccharide export protein KpsE/RkpR
MTSEDRLQERIGELADALTYANGIVEELEKDSDTLEAALKIATGLRDDLSTAESVETEADFDANITNARTKLVELTTAVKAAKQLADEAPEVTDILAECNSAIRQLRRELSDLGES